MPSEKRKSKEKHREKEKEKERDAEPEKDVAEDVEMEEEEEDEEGGIRIGDIYLPPPPLPACTFDSTGPRMVITHIENEFFKSYAGKQVRKLCRT